MTMCWCQVRAAALRSVIGRRALPWPKVLRKAGRFGWEYEIYYCMCIYIIIIIIYIYIIIIIIYIIIII